jgi:hypothetical protein
VIAADAVGALALVGCIITLFFAVMLVALVVTYMRRGPLSKAARRDLLVSRTMKRLEASLVCTIVLVLVATALAAIAGAR